MSDLHTRYRRLLFAYPAEYRRYRGDEIAATYVELSLPAQHHPRPRDAVTLLMCGLRARLGRPASRWIVPIALLAVLIGGLAGAAGGARLGWFGSTSLSRTQWTDIDRFLIGPAIGGYPAGGERFAGYAMNGPAVVQESLDPDSLGDGRTAEPITFSPRQLVDRERMRLTGTGWTVSATTITATGATMTLRDGSLVARLATITVPARRLNGAGQGSPLFMSFPTPMIRDGVPAVSSSPGQNGFVASSYRATPGTVGLLATIGGLLGAALTFLLVGWLSRRLADLPSGVGRLMVAASLTAAATAAPASTVAAAAVWSEATRRSPLPIFYWIGFTHGFAHELAVASLALLTIAVAVAAVTRPSRRQEAVKALR